MTVDEFLASMENLNRGLDAEILKILEVESEILTKKIRRRVKEKGIVSKGYDDSSGKATTPYSNKSGWKEKRKKKGLQIGYKDLYFNGDLFDSFIPRESKSDGNTITVMSSVDTSGKGEKKVLGLSKQEGLTGSYVTDPIKPELDEAYKNIEDKIIQYLKTFGL
jgi:hypothetical protein